MTQKDMQNLKPLMARHCWLSVNFLFVGYQSCHGDKVAGACPHLQYQYWESMAT